MLLPWRPQEIDGELLCLVVQDFQIRFCFGILHCIALTSSLSTSHSSHTDCVYDV